MFDWEWSTEVRHCECYEERLIFAASPFSIGRSPARVGTISMQKALAFEDISPSGAWSCSMSTTFRPLKGISYFDRDAPSQRSRLCASTTRSWRAR